MNETATERRVIDAFAVNLGTKSACITDFFVDPADKKYIAAIRTTYFFDRNQQICCCEVTPSYRLFYLFDEVHLTPEGDALDDDAKQELYSTYEQGGGVDYYIHCNRIDRMIETNTPGTVVHVGDVPANCRGDGEDFEENYVQDLEIIREALSGNHPF